MMADRFRKGWMDQKLKWRLAIIVFSLCWLVYLVVPCFSVTCALGQLLAPFSSEPANLVFLMIIFLAVSVSVTDLFEYAYRQARRLKWFRPRLGEVLVARGYISREELNAALDEQKLRLGDMLVRSGAIDSEELEQALEKQKAAPHRPLGALLIETGRVTESDIDWAYHRINRKLGKILIERGLIAESDLRRVLGRMWYGRYQGL